VMLDAVILLFSLPAASLKREDEGTNCTKV
jgi:hypothetical protein